MYRSGVLLELLVDVRFVDTLSSPPPPNSGPSIKLGTVTYVHRPLTVFESPLSLFAD